MNERFVAVDAFFSHALCTVTWSDWYGRGPSYEWLPMPVVSPNFAGSDLRIRRGYKRFVGLSSASPPSPTPLVNMFFKPRVSLTRMLGSLTSPGSWRRWGLGRRVSGHVASI